MAENFKLTKETIERSSSAKPAVKRQTMKQGCMNSMRILIATAGLIGCTGLAASANSAAFSFPEQLLQAPAADMEPVTSITGPSPADKKYTRFTTDLQITNVQPEVQSIQVKASRVPTGTGESIFLLSVLAALACSLGAIIFVWDKLFVQGFEMKTG